MYNALRFGDIETRPFEIDENYIKKLSIKRVNLINKRNYLIKNINEREKYLKSWGRKITRITSSKKEKKKMDKNKKKAKELIGFLKKELKWTNKRLFVIDGILILKSFSRIL